MTAIISTPDGGIIPALNPTATSVAVSMSEDQKVLTMDLRSMTNKCPDQSDGDLLEARALVDKYPESPTALARLAICEYSFGNRVSAGEAAQKTLDCETVDASALMVASRVCSAIGDFDTAEKSLHKILRSPQSGDGARNAAAFFAASIASHQGNSEEALDLLAPAEGGPCSALRGAVLAQMGRPHDAIHELRSALKSVPDSPATLCSLGYAYAAAGSLSKAIRTTAAATALAPADRAAGLNLSALLIANGEHSEAVKAIDHLAAHHPGDIRLEIAAAIALHAAGESANALQRLRRAEVPTRDGSAASEELRLNITLLKNPTMPRTSVFALAHEALQRCDYRSELIARVLASTAESPANLAALENAHTELRRHYDRRALLPVEHQAAFLRFEFDRSLDAALEWAAVEPFSADAHIVATYLLSLHAGDHHKAAQIGLAGIRRGISSDLLSNNTAFALAMDNSLDEAERVLPDPSRCDLALATSGLVEATRGNLAVALALYEESAKQIRQSGDDFLACIVEMGSALAVLASGHTVPADHKALIESSIEDDPRTVLLHQAVLRERSARQTPISVNA